MELTVQNLVKQYPKKRAVDDISFTLSEGIYGLLGPNGAGKTTLVNMIAGILKPTSGEVLWNGENIDKLDWRYREILGFQPQTPSLYGSFTAEEFLRYMAAVKGLVWMTVVTLLSAWAVALSACVMAEPIMMQLSASATQPIK